MERDAFWLIMDRAFKAAPGNPQKRELAFTTELRKLGKADLQSFAQLFDEAMDEAYSWGLWGAAFVIGGGCSDDAFSDFRSSLISRGRVAFERAVADPDSLAEEDLDEDSWFYEGFAYIPTAAVEKAFGSALPRGSAHPAAPSGTEWSEETVHELYPRLAEKYG